MIPADYICSGCGAEGLKLWRVSACSAVTLLCGACTEREQGRPLDLSKSDQCWGRCPAIPDLRGEWWGYTSVPPEGVAWWQALPLRMEGEWPVWGGVERWVPCREGMTEVLAERAILRRIVHTPVSRVLVFVMHRGKGA